jgi:hypothetical protein
MIRRASAAALTAVVLALAAGAVTGCGSPTPSPTPSATPAFATEEEAFAAAEATYRAYVEALNAVDLSDPATFEPVYAWTTGDANAGARESFSQMHADGWTVGGQSTVALFQLHDYAEDIVADVCLDVSLVTVVDASTTSMVDPERSNVQAMRVRFHDTSASTTGLVIANIDGRSDGPTCE